MHYRILYIIIYIYIYIYIFFFFSFSNPLTPIESCDTCCRYFSCCTQTTNHVLPMSLEDAEVSILSLYVFAEMPARPITLR